MFDLKKDSIPFFRELNRSQLKIFAGITKHYKCSNGDIIFLQGEFCPYWVIVYSGSILSRGRQENDIVNETILLPGDSFDFESTLSKSVTTHSLEAVEDCEILLINVPLLKKLALKNSIPLSLIKLQLDENEASIWEKYILTSSKIKNHASFVIKQSRVWKILKTVPILVLTVGLTLFFKDYWLFFLGGYLLTIIFSLFKRELSFLEINRDAVILKEFKLKRVSANNSSIPISSVDTSCVVYENGFLKLFHIGGVLFKSTIGDIQLNGLFRPDKLLEKVQEYKIENVDVDKALNITSFKNLFCKKNNLFFIESDIEDNNSSFYSFKKTVFFFLIKTVPALVIFLLTSVGLTLFFNVKYFLLLNLPTLLYTIWCFLDWTNDKYYFENGKLIDIEKKPLWGKEVKTVADLLSIQSVVKDQKNLFQVMFNYGDIKIYTIGGELTYPSIKRPDHVIENLYLVKRYYQLKKENIDKQQRQEEFLSYTKYYQELAEK